MVEIPARGGTYLLHLRLTDPCRLDIGKLGQYRLLPGDYIYVGSALGPGGLQARLRRHIDGGTKRFWHIDHLRPYARVAGYVFVAHQHDKELSPRFECKWSQALAQLPGARAIVPGFGASDCQSGCKAHLLFFSETISLSILVKKLNPVSGGNPIYFVDWMG